MTHVASDPQPHVLSPEDQQLAEDIIRWYAELDIKPIVGQCLSINEDTGQACGCAVGVWLCGVHSRVKPEEWYKKFGGTDFSYYRAVSLYTRRSRDFISGVWHGFDGMAPGRRETYDGYDEARRGYAVGQYVREKVLS
jgi:hypothetical protein